jgi:hypothetical protein
MAEALVGVSHAVMALSEFCGCRYIDMLKSLTDAGLLTSKDSDALQSLIEDQIAERIESLENHL